MSGSHESKRPAACEQARRALWEAAPHSDVGASAERHRAGCAFCQADVAHLADVRRLVVTSHEHLTDLTRARIEARVAAALAPAPSRWRLPAPRWRWALLAPVAALAGWVALVARPARHEVAVLEPVGSVNPAPPAKSAPPEMLTPFPGATPARPAPARTRLTAATDQVVRAAVGERARVTLLGPGRVEVVAVAGSRVELRLVEGTLVGDYDHEKGGSLRIWSPGAVTDVVGTLFSIEALGQASRIRVAHGVVMVRAGVAEPRRVAGGESLTSTATAPERLTDEERGRLTDEETALRAAAGTTVLVAPRIQDRVAKIPDAAGAGGTVLVTPRTQDRVAKIPDAAAEVGVPVSPPLAPATTTPLRSPEVHPLEPVRAVRMEARPPHETAPSTYARAEAAMAAGKVDEARALLESVVREVGSDRERAPARVELAKLAYARRSYAEAAEWIKPLQRELPDAALQESAQFMWCRILVAQHEPSEGCLTAFRAQRPSAAYDAAALALLITEAAHKSVCVRVEALVAEYEARYSEGTFATEARRMRAVCGANPADASPLR